jgi:hypothetical protein
MMNINLSDIGGTILITGIAIAFAQELWYFDTKFYVLPMGLTVFIPSVIISIGGIVLIYDYWRKMQ